MATTVSVNTPPRIIPLEDGWNKEIKEKVRGCCHLLLRFVVVYALIPTY